MFMHRNDGSPEAPPSADALSSQDFGRLLKQLRTGAGLTHQALADELNQHRPTITQWEGGRHLPAEDKVQLLDAVLDGHGQLIKLAEAVRAVQRRKRSRATEPPRETKPNLVEVLRDVGSAFSSRVISVDGLLGWRHELQNPVTFGDEPTALATAYGLKIVLALRESGIWTADRDPDGNNISLGRIKAALVASRYEYRDEVSGVVVRGWAASTLLKQAPIDGAQKHEAAIPNATTAGPPTAEVSAAVIDAIVRLDPGLDPDERAQHLTLLGDLVDGFARSRPSVLCSVLETVLRLDPDSDLARDLVETLLKLRKADHLWRERNSEFLVRPLPSVAQTSRVIWVLQLAADRMRERPEGLTEAIDLAVTWLTQQPELRSVIEVLDRPGDAHQLYPLRHFTAAWVVRALIATGWFDSANLASREAMTELWKAYDAEKHHLWIWRTGDMPISMTFDAIEALKLSALARTTPDAVASLDLRHTA